VPQTITVSEKALAAHLAHGDLDIPCEDSCYADAGACDDGNPCTSDSCDAGRCSNEPPAPDACDDADITTADSCDPAIGCVNQCVGQPTEPCGFANGTFTLYDPATETCDSDSWISVQINILFEAQVLNGKILDGDVEPILEQIQAAKPELVAGLQTIFASFTPSLTLNCQDIAVQPNAALPAIYFGQVFTVNLWYAIQKSALPDGVTEASVVSKIKSEYTNNPFMFNPLQQLLSDLANGVSMAYVTVDVY